MGSVPQMLEQFGGLEEGCHLYGEDIDLAYRAQQAGWERCYVRARSSSTTTRP